MNRFDLSVKSGWGRSSLLAVLACLLLCAFTTTDADARYRHHYQGQTRHHTRHHPPLHAPPVTAPAPVTPTTATAPASPTTTTTTTTTTTAPAAASTGRLEGYLFEDLLSGQIAAAAADQPVFNPASNTKVATTLTLLQTFSPDYKFTTDIRTDGIIDAKGVLQGNLYVSGRYLLFGDDQAKELLRRLQKKRIKAVSGNLVISSDFTMNVTEDGFVASNHLLKILDPPKFGSQDVVKIIHKRHHTYKVVIKSTAPFINFTGNVVTGSPPASSVLLVQNISPPLKDLLKEMLCYSNNDMAERFGKMIGGPDAVTKEVVSLGVDPSEVNFASTSGLLINRMSPRAMMAVIRALRLKLEQNKLELSDLLTVSGIDAGTMHNRLNWSPVRGSVISKTGTLAPTDKGVTALSGELHTNQGVFLFVIFEIHGDVSTFRQREDSLVAQFEQAHGGAKAIRYTPIIPRVNGEETWQ
ncbi:MAG: D-alanyl-D-alanine carboxypeptidase [Candidatus Obscuribacterales bacterium]|nr:D-alanyl-D-alanine carboxypeptidase [Candidatus Obscuribacterales bacterium]